MRLMRDEVLAELAKGKGIDLFGNLYVKFRYVEDHDSSGANRTCPRKSLLIALQVIIDGIGLLATQDARGAEKGGKPIGALITQISHPHHAYCRKCG